MQTRAQEGVATSCMSTTSLAAHLCLRFHSSSTYCGQAREESHQTPEHNSMRLGHGT